MAKVAVFQVALISVSLAARLAISLEFQLAVFFAAKAQAVILVATILHLLHRHQGHYRPEGVIVKRPHYPHLLEDNMLQQEFPQRRGEVGATTLQNNR